VVFAGVCRGNSQPLLPFSVGRLDRLLVLVNAFAYSDVWAV
jgi:hypothetical protein